jgi:hypothetical protein
VKPLLQERTKKKIQVLSGSGRDELLKVKITNLLFSKFVSGMLFPGMKVTTASTITYIHVMQIHLSNTAKLVFPTILLWRL